MSESIKYLKNHYKCSEMQIHEMYYESIDLSISSKHLFIDWLRVRIRDIKDRQDKMKEILK